MEKTTVYNLVVLDESGSMGCIKQQTINGFNETIQTIATAQKKFPEQNHLVTLVNFNSDAIRTVLELAQINQAAPLNAKTYEPNNGTPLYDALGISLSKLRLQIDNKTDHQVLVTIITDGEENTSKEFTLQMIKRMIDELKAMGWVFTFIGANIDVAKVAAQISVNNYISFNQTNEGTQAMFVKESNARMKFFDKMSKGESKEKLADKYFEE